MDHGTVTVMPADRPTGVASEAFVDWWSDRHRSNHFEVRRIPFAELDRWHFVAGSGNLVHDSGKFFSVEGLRISGAPGPVRNWEQPILNQPEIGILGILVKDIGGVRHCLLQAKMEPGNINTLQLSPTVQATRSNYTLVHGGTPVRYLEYFTEPRRGRVLVDVLQSEHGTWFYRKRNRNIIVETTEDVPLHDDYFWLPLAQLGQLMHNDNLLNMDARTVLSCLPAAPRPAGMTQHEDPFDAALERSLSGEAARHSTVDLLSWFTEIKTRQDVVAERVGLDAVCGWSRTAGTIERPDGRFFSVMAVSVEAGNREVHRWTQPLIAPSARGVVGFIAKEFDGVLHMLAQGRVEGGFLDAVELGPTVQCVPDNYRGWPAERRPAFLDYILEARPDQVRFEAVMSEEGGRLYHAESRYVVVEADADFPSVEPAGYRWVTLAQMSSLLVHCHYLNVHARSLIACLKLLAA